MSTRKPSRSAPPTTGQPLDVNDVQQLKSLRNSVIGSRTRKSEVVAQGRVPELVTLLSRNDASDEARGIIATILGSLANGAPPPTLLSLCRADTANVLFVLLAKGAKAVAALMAAEDGAGAQEKQPSPPVAVHLSLIEAFLRALRSLFKALADAAGSPNSRAANDGSIVGTPPGSLSVCSGSGQNSPRLAVTSTSAREVVGWHIANAGFDTRSEEFGARAYPSPMPLRHQGRSESGDSTDNGTLPPEVELMLRARGAIDFAFKAENIGVWLGAMYLGKLPRGKSSNASEATKSGRATATNSRIASGATSRSSTRPASPAPGVVSPMTSSDQISRTSSRMSMTSDGQRPNSSATIFSAPSRLLSIVEMVSGILAGCLSVACIREESDIASSVRKVVDRRRSTIVSFTASKSPYWYQSGKDEEEDRGRDTLLSGSAGVNDGMQASFVKRGKSIDGRARSQEPHDTAIDIDSSNNESTTYPPSKTILQVLLDAVQCGYAKTQEVALWALAEMCRESREANRHLFASHDERGEAPTTLLLSLRTDAAIPVRLAALCCLAHIVKVDPFTTVTNNCILAGLVDLIEIPGSIQVRAIYALSDMLADNPALQWTAATELGCVEKLTALLLSTRNAALWPVDARQLASVVGPFTVSGSDEHLACLREASFRTLAALCFQHDEIRRRFVDQNGTSPLPLVVQSLTTSRAGVRLAACSLIRAVSRSVSILRTSLVDTGVAPKLLSLLQDEHEAKEVKIEVLAALCNLVLKFSPVRQQLIDGDGIQQIAALSKSNDGMLRLNAFWAVRNALYYAHPTQKQRIMQVVGWDVVRQASLSSDIDLQCEALGIVRNTTSNSNGSEVRDALNGLGGGDELLDIVEKVIWQRRSGDVIEQAAYILVNIAASSDEHRALILDRSNLLDALVFFLNFPRPGVRVAGIWAINNLTPSSAFGSVPLPEALARLMRFSFNVRLKELVDDPERDVSDRAKSLLHRLSPLHA